MTDVTKSKLSANERSKTSTQLQKSEAKMRKSSAVAPPSRDDSSVYTSESGSSSSETTGDNCSSKTRRDADCLLVDSNNFEERAKRFLETMPEERRKEWLRQQGYTYNRDGLLIPPAHIGQSSAITETSIQSHLPRKKFTHVGGSWKAAYGSGDENHNYAVEQAGRRGQYSESRGESDSTPSHDSVSASSDAEEDCCQADNKSEAGDYGQWADVAERPTSESPNAVIQNRFARLMARMSDVGGGFPEMGDMEITTVHDENFGDESEKSINEFTHNDMGAGPRLKQKLDTGEGKQGKTDGVEYVQPESNNVKPDRVKEVDRGDRGCANVQIEKKAVIQDVDINKEHAKIPATSKYSNVPGLSSKLKEAYRPVVDEAVVSVLGDLNTAQRSEGLHTDKRLIKVAIRTTEVKADASRDNSATPRRVEAIVKKRRDSGGTYVIADQTSMSTPDDRGTTRSNSARDDQMIDEASLPVKEPSELHRIVEPSSESKETPHPLIEGENSQEKHSISVDCEDALVTFKNQPSEEGEQAMGSSSVTISKNSNCYKHRLGGENFQNVNDNFQDYSKRIEFQAHGGLGDNGELSEAEIRLANLRKLVDKELVKSALRNSQLNADISCDKRVPTNSGNPCTAEPKNKKGGGDRMNNESDSASPCFVTGNKMTVSKKIRGGNFSKTVSVPVPRAKVSSTQSLLGKSATTNSTVIVEKRPMKKAATCGRLETIAETSSVSSCQSSDTNNAQRKLKTENISCTIKVNKTPKVKGQLKEHDEKLSGFEGFENECPVKKPQQDGSNKDKDTLNIYRTTANTGTMISRQANTAEKKTAKLKLPLIKSTMNKPKTMPESSTNASFKLPKIKTEENQLVLGQARAQKEASTERGFLPPVTNDTKSNVSVAHKNKPVHLPNVQRATVESTKSKGVSDTQNDIYNTTKKDSLRPPTFNLARNQCGDKELKPKFALQRRLLDIAESKQGDSVDVSNTPSSTKDKRNKQGFNQIEAEIQREIDTKLKQAKQKKSAPPKGFLPKSLSAKEKSMVKAKMDVLDEVSEDNDEVGDEEDESEFLSRIVSSDCRLTMYGKTKDTPLIRKIGASSLDTMKESLGVGDVSKNGKVKNVGEECDTVVGGKQSTKEKVSYQDIKSNALRTAKQRALLTAVQGSSQDADEGTSQDSDAYLNESSNALVARDDIAHWVGSNVRLGNLCEEEIREECVQSKDHVPSILSQADKFDVDVLILDESSYTHYGISSQRYYSMKPFDSVCKASVNLTKERNTNANNSKGGSDVDDNLIQNEGLSERARSSIMDKENRDCFSSSLGAPKKLRARRSNKETTRNSRIPVRTGSRKKYEQNKCTCQATRQKTVSFQCDKIPQKLVVILNNKDGVKVGQAEAPIIFTDNEAIRYCNQAGGSSNRDESYTLEIRGESTEPAPAAASPANWQGDEWRKLPLSERLKKYQKAKPRNIHSGMYHKADRAPSTDVKQKTHNVSGQQCVKPPSVEKTSFGKRNGPERPATDEKIRDARGTPKQTHHDLVRNMPLHSSASPKRTLHKPLLRPELSPQTENIHMPTNLMSQCELFSASSSLGATQDHDDDLPIAESIDAVKACSTSTKCINGKTKQSDHKTADEATTLEQRGDNVFGRDIKSPSLLADYTKSSHKRTVVDSGKPVKSQRSFEYQPTPDVDDSLQLFLHHEQTLAQAKMPSAAPSEGDDLVSAARRGVSMSISGDYDSDEDEGLRKRRTGRNATRSPGVTAVERREDEGIGASSPKRTQYVDNFKRNLLHHSSLEDEGQVELGKEGKGQREQGQVLRHSSSEDESRNERDQWGKWPREQSQALQGQVTKSPALTAVDRQEDEGIGACSPKRNSYRDGLNGNPLSHSSSEDEDRGERGQRGKWQRALQDQANWSPALIAIERREDESTMSFSPRRTQYMDSQECTPLRHSSSEDEGLVKSGQLQKWQGAQGHTLQGREEQFQKEQGQEQQGQEQQGQEKQDQEEQGQEEQGQEEQGQEKQGQEEQVLGVHGQDEEGNDEVKGTYLKLIYRKVKKHFFNRDSDDPHNSPGKHTITAEDGANHETHSVYMSHEELGREDDSSATPYELRGDSPDDDADMSYDERTQRSFYSNDDSIEKTYSIATEKKAPNTSDTKDTDVENISTSDFTTNENHPLNARTNSTKDANKMAAQLRHKNYMDPKQIVLKKMASAFAPIPATSPPIRSKQATRPKGNLFDSVAFTSEESLAEGAATLSDANKNESRISVEKDEVGSQNCDFEKRRPDTKPCCSRAPVQNHKNVNEVSSVRSGRKSEPCTIPKAGNHQKEVLTPGTRHVGATSSRQTNHCQRSSVPSATEASRDSEKPPPRTCTNSPRKNKLWPGDAESPNAGRGSDASQAEFSPWPHDQETQEEGMATTTVSSATKPTVDGGNNDRDLDARKKNANSHPRPDTLPPLSNRQTGLPHRPKVKRHY